MEVGLRLFWTGAQSFGEKLLNFSLPVLLAASFNFPYTSVRFSKILGQISCISALIIDMSSLIIDMSTICVTSQWLAWQCQWLDDYSQNWARLFVTDLRDYVNDLRAGLMKKRSMTRDFGQWWGILVKDLGDRVHEINHNIEISSKKTFRMELCVF